MSAPATRKSTEPIANALHSAAIHLLRRLRKEDEQSGVSPARLSVLSVLVFGGPMRLSELARIEQVKPPTMTKIIAGLEADGFVKRRADGADARAYRVKATARGTTLLHAGRRRRVERLSKGLIRLPPGEVRILMQAAEIIEQLVRDI